MTDKNDAFLSRWSRLKRQGGETPPAVAPATQEQPPVHAEADPAAALTLDDVAALKEDADFRPFLAAAASEAVHRAALRKLWASDPIITTHDGLTDYADDYTFKADVAEQIRTAWRGGADAWEQADAENREESAQDAGDESGGNRYAQQSITNLKSEQNSPIAADIKSDPFADA